MLALLLELFSSQLELLLKVLQVYATSVLPFNLMSVIIFHFLIFQVVNPLTSKIGGQFSPLAATHFLVN